MSYKSYTDAYRSRIGGSSNSYPRSTSSSLPNYRSNYTNISNNSSRLPSKERTAGVSVGAAAFKRDKVQDKPTFQFSCSKETEKSRLGRSTSNEVVGSKSPLSNSRSSLLEKYTYPTAQKTERTSSVLDRYNRGISREKSREPEIASPRYGLSRNFNGSERSESFRNLGVNSTLTSRETSPDTSSKSSSFRVYSRVPSYRNGANSGGTESSAPTSRYTARYSMSSRQPTAYSCSDAFRAPSVKEDKGKKEEGQEKGQAVVSEKKKKPTDSSQSDDSKSLDLVTISVTSRATSPSPPASSTYVRTRRADNAKILQKQVTRSRKKLETKDQEVQVDKIDGGPVNGNNYSRYGGRTWSYLASQNSSFRGSGNTSTGRIPTAFGYSKQNVETDEPKGVKSIPRLNALEAKKSEESCIPKKESSVSKSRSSTPKRQITRSSSSDGSANVPIGRSKSTSSNSSHSSKIKSTPPPSPKSHSSIRQSTPDTRAGKPPVPKSESMKFVNKDFRKSALNMETADSRNHRKLKKNQRSVSVSSQDSEGNSENQHLHVTSSSSSSSIKVKRASSGNVSAPSSKSAKKVSHSETSASSSESENSSSSEEGEEEEEDEGEETGGRKGGNCRKLSAASSRGSSVLMSSADELTSDKPPRPPLSKSKNDEAKSFLMRALAPVTNLFKVKQQQDGDCKSGGWLEASDEATEMSKRPSQSISKASIAQSISKSLSFTNSERNHPANSDITPNTSNNSGSSNKRMFQTRIRHQDSGEKPWWLDPNPDNVPEGVERTSVCNDDVSQDTTVSCALSDDGKFKYKVWRQDSGEKEWWLETPETKEEAEEDLVRKRKSCSASPKSTRSSLKSLDSKKHRLIHQQSGEQAWWMSNDPKNVPEGVEVYQDSTESDNKFLKPTARIRHIESGEKAWWMDSSSKIPDGIEKIPTEVVSNSNSDDSSESFDNFEINVNSQTESSSSKRNFVKFPNIQFPPPPVEEPLGDRASPEGIENPPDPPDNYCDRAISPYDNIFPSRRTTTPRKRPSTLPLFIGDHRNIDDLLGDVLPPAHSPIMSRFHRKETCSSDESSSECEEIDAAQVIIHDSTPKTPIIQRRHIDNERPQPDGYIPLDDTALQLYKDGDYGAYLDLEASISEQQEEFEGFQTNRKNSIVLRTQLSVRVHTIIEKLLNSEGRELRRALFSLKQIFQEDKDLVHEFVQNDGLACLIKVGSEADQNYQNYILRALGQVMLYVDGMNGVMEHGQTVQWLYTLIASRFRLVVKTALKLLLVFVEYVETNSLLLVRAVRSVDTSRGMIPWTNVMKLLKDYDAADTELLIYATTLVNKCLNGIPDQDTYYDQVDCLEEQGIEGIIQRYMSKQGTDLDLLRQFQIYEAVLHHEDGNDRGSPIRQLDDNIRKTLRNRKSLVDSHERRKSRRHSTGTSPLSMSLNARLSPRLNNSLAFNTLNSSLPDDDDESSSSQSSQGHLGEVQLNGSYKENKVDVGVTPALRRRRERAERQRSFIREQQEATANMRASIGHSDDQESSPFGTNGIRYTNGTTTYERNADSPSNKLSRANSRKDLTPLMNAANKLDSEEKKPWYGKSPDEGVECDEGNHTDDDDEDRRVVLQLKRENTVKDLTQKLTAQNLIPSSPVEDKVSRIGDMSGLISKAKEGLAKSKSKADVLKSPTGDNLPKLQEIKKSENELHWEELIKKMNRPLALCDLDFTDLNSDDEVDVLGPVNVTNGIPPPPPPMVPSSGSRPPPPPPGGGKLPPPLPNGPPLFGANLKSSRNPVPNTANDSGNATSKNPLVSQSSSTAKKSKKTVKLFWKEVRDDPIILSRLDKNKMIWDELSPVPVDTQKLEHLFESRAKDLITKKQQEMNKNKEIIVLDHKRSNAINIGMTKLPPPRSIKTAILKMDATIMNREGIEKLLTMLPTEEERSRIQEAQAANPDLPLGSAEQFLLTLASISELPARLKLWAFKLDFENCEKEIADPLMDLKQGMETLKVNKTFRGILSTLLSIGIFLNGNEVKGFQLEYLAKVPEVKDTVHKHSLLHHLCHMVMEKFPDSTDLYSEIGAVTRASKIDFDELASNIGKLESECKASWDHLKLIAKHDGSTMMKVKMSDFLADCAERIIVLGIVHRRIINRFHKFILWLGIPLHRVQDTKPNEFCRIVSEFALEYRTTRERVIQQLEKKANHRERNKTRGKMITEVGKFRTKEDRADAELRQLLGSDISDVESIHGTLPWRRQRKDGRTSLGPLLRDETTNGNLTDGDDELLESLVKTATKSPATRTTPRERKRTRHADRKSLRRTLKNGLSEEEKKHIAAYIKGY